MSTLKKLLSFLFIIGCACGLDAEPNGYRFEKQFILFDSYHDPPRATGYCNTGV